MNGRSAFLVLLVVAGPAFAEGVAEAVRNVLGGDPEEYRRVIGAFQTALREADGPAAARLVAYPIEVEVDGRSEVIRTEERLAAVFGRIATPGLVAAVANQPFERLFVRDQGVMLGNGEVWVTGICRNPACDQQDVRVIAIQSLD